MNLLFNIYFRAALKLVMRPPHLRVFINYFKYTLCRLLKNEIVSHTPANVVIYATKNCNLNCPFCFIGNDLNPPDGYKYQLTLEDYKKLSETGFIKNALRIGLLGGEPFLCKDIFKILELMKTQKKIITVVTNATLVKEAKLEKFQETAPDILGLSLYKSNHNDVARVYSAMKNKSILWIQTIIEATDLALIEKAIEFCLKIGCNNLRLSNFYPTYGENMDKVIFDDDKNFFRYKTAINKKYKDQIRIDWPFPIARKILKKQCLQPINYVHLDNQGAIGACFMRAPNEAIHGNVFDDNAWNGKFHIDLRRKMNSKGTECDPVCRYCEDLSEDLYKI